MKYILITITLVVFGCSDQEKLFEQGNVAPVVAFAEQKTAHADSIKLSLKKSQGKYSTRLFFSDRNNNLKEIGYTIKTGEGKVLANGIEQRGKKIEVNLKEAIEGVTIDYVPAAKGYHVIEFYAFDQFDKKGTARLELTGFDNLKPTASFTIQPQQVRDPRQYIVDATKSFDSDQEFGGGIVWYKYKFNAIEKLTKESTLKYIFPETQENETGVWNISVSVQDNDGEWSSEVVNFVTVR